MKNICIVGTGQIGSRHLQALKNISSPLNIHLVDPSQKSLETAVKRYEDFPGLKTDKNIVCHSSLEALPTDIDLAIIATNSDIRSEIIRKLLERGKVTYFLLEKLLFQKRKDYGDIGKLFTVNKSKAWVNCSMRMVSFYREIKKKLHSGRPITYSVSGNQSGLITNSIHFLDNLAYLVDCTDFTVDTRRLNKKIYPSKRAGFVELFGTLDVSFSDGSAGTFSANMSGSSPTLINIFGSNIRYIIRESEGKMWYSEEKSAWKWEETNVSLPFQSEMTTSVVEEIIKRGNCFLPTYEISAKIHQIYLEALLKHINAFSRKKFSYYPFT